MPAHIANPQVIAKIERLSRLTGLGKTATVEAAADRMLSEFAADSSSDPWAGIDAIVAQLHRLLDDLLQAGNNFSQTDITPAPTMQ
jgi:antitoxin VapB